MFKSYSKQQLSASQLATIKRSAETKGFGFQSAYCTWNTIVELIDELNQQLMNGTFTTDISHLNEKFNCVPNEVKIDIVRTFEYIILGIMKEENMKLRQREKAMGIDPFTLYVKRSMVITELKQLHTTK